MTTSGVVERDGFLLRWDREGNGVPILVLGAREFYRREFPQSMRAHFEMVFCDLRHWVPTPEGFDVATLRIDAWYDDIEAVREATALDRSIVMGHSHHAHLALRYAAARPDSVRGVVVVASGPPGVDIAPTVAEFFREDASPERKASYKAARASRKGKVVVSGQDYIDDYIANDPAGFYDSAMTSAPLWEGVALNYEVMTAGLDGLGTLPFSGIDVPVFVALGRYDYGTPYFVWDEPKKQFGNLRCQLYERSGHHPPYEQPDEFTADLVDWASDL